MKTGKLSFSGRNITGKITVRNKNLGKKKSFLFIDKYRRYKKISLCIQANKVSYINSFVSLIKFSDGTYSYILSAHGTKPGKYIFNTIKPPKFSLKYSLNCNVIIRYLKYNSIFYNLEIKLNNGGKYAKSAGVFCKLININLDKNLAKIILPTGKIKIISVFCFVSLGRVSNIFYKTQIFSKAGFNRNLGIKPSVRGVAMNPIDHPHGGRTKSNSPELTPWGKIAKFNH